MLKLFPLDAAAGAVMEFENLSSVAVVPVRTPEPVAIDLAGDWFGTPAIVMSRLPGTPDLHPKDQNVWIADTAAALAAIHRLPSTGARAPVPPRWERWTPPVVGLGDRLQEIEAALAELRRVAQTLPVVFSHDDFNASNILFNRGRLSGVVDWSDVTVECRQSSVALLRHFLAILPGGDAPERFLLAYQTAAGTVLSDLALWDVFYGLRGTGPVEHWVSAFEQFDVSISLAEINHRSRTWVESAIKTLHA